VSTAGPPSGDPAGKRDRRTGFPLSESASSILKPLLPIAGPGPGPGR
jgi:hypothetical protein